MSTATDMRRYLRRHGPTSGPTLARALGVRPQVIYRAAIAHGINHLLCDWPVNCGRWVRQRRVYFLDGQTLSIQIVFC